MSLLSLTKHFKSIEGHRQAAKVTYPLFDVLFLTVVVIGGCEAWEDIEELCIGNGGANSRLISANEATLSLLDIHFPKELLPSWHSIQNQMRKYGPRTNFEGKVVEGAISHTMSRKRNCTASKITKYFYGLSKELE